MLASVLSKARCRCKRLCNSKQELQVRLPTALLHKTAEYSKWFKTEQYSNCCSKSSTNQQVMACRTEYQKTASSFSQKSSLSFYTIAIRLSLIKLAINKATWLYDI